MNRHKANKHDRHGKQKSKQTSDKSKQARERTKGGVHKGQMQVWIECT